MNYRHSHLLPLVFFLLLSSCTTTRQNHELPFSIILSGGTVWSGSGDTPTITDIGIRMGRIIAIGDLSASAAYQRLNVSGLDVVPGFIDIHSHAVRDTKEDSDIFKHPDAESYIRQGVTSVISGPDGNSAFPISSVLEDLTVSPAAINFGTFIGHNTIRNEIMGRDNRKPSKEELEAMKALVNTAMQDGAYGLSSGLKYIPGAYADTEEVIALARVAGEHGGIYITHMREEGLNLINSVKETIKIGAVAKLPAQITHHKVMGGEMWGKSIETLALIDAANARGVDVSSDQYPYIATSTMIGVLFPAWSLAGTTEEQQARLQQPETRARIKEKIIYSLIHDRGGDDPSRIAIAECKWAPDLNGKNFAEILRERNQLVNIDLAAELAMEFQEKGGCSAIYYAMSEDDVARIMQHPRTMIASDGGIFVPGEGAPHPRNYGSFARVLAYYVREKKVISAAAAIHKMSMMPANRIGLSHRGRIEVDAIADIAILNLNIIQDQATFPQPHQYATGVEFVLVNGVLVLNKGQMTGKRPGLPLRSAAYLKK